MKVTKRDGTKEDLNIDKLHKVVMYAVENLTGVSASQVEINSQIQFYDGIASTDIQETLIKSTADLISEETPNYKRYRYVVPSGTTLPKYRVFSTKVLLTGDENAENVPRIKNLSSQAVVKDVLDAMAAAVNKV